MGTGKTVAAIDGLEWAGGPQWSLVVETGKTDQLRRTTERLGLPRWCPVVETGKTGNWEAEVFGQELASMEPGRGDREDLGEQGRHEVTQVASMEPGRGDREDKGGHD